MKKNKQLLGAHMSISGGLEKALYAAEEVHSTAVQIFTKSNQQWQAKPLSAEQVDLFLETKEEAGLSVGVHGCYLMNLCASDSTTLKKSQAALHTELDRCEQLDIPILIMHPGARKEQALDASLKKVAETINNVFDHFKGKTKLLVEMMAGQGSIIGSSIEQIATIIDHVEHKRLVGVCLDTCHLFAAGYAIDTKEGYQDFLKDFDKNIGINKIGAFHLNNSAKPLGSKVDRHAHIVDGVMSTDAFKFIMNDDRFVDVPKFLETPKSADLHEDKKNLRALIELVDKKQHATIANTPLSYYLS